MEIEMETETETEIEMEMEMGLELRVHVGLWSLATSLELRPQLPVLRRRNTRCRFMPWTCQAKFAVGNAH